MFCRPTHFSPNGLVWCHTCPKTSCCAETASEHTCNVAHSPPSRNLWGLGISSMCEFARKVIACVKHVLLHVDMASSGRNVSILFLLKQTESHTWRAALHGRYRLMVQRIVKYMANTINVRMFARDLSSATVQKNDSQFVPNGRLLGVERTRHQEPPDIQRHRGHCNLWSHRGRPSGVTGKVDDLGESLGSPEYVPLKTNNRRDVEPHPVRETQCFPNGKVPEEANVLKK